MIRTYEPGDGERQAALYNVAAATLPAFKPATVEDVRRRTSAHGFDPQTRFYAEDNGRLVGYATFDPHTGRVSFPWTLPDADECADLLFTRVLDAMRGRGLTRAFAAYRHDWSNVLAFFTRHGFTLQREMVNYTQALTDLPTMIQRTGLNVVPLAAEHLPAAESLCPQLLGLQGSALADYLLRNSRFPEPSLFALLRGNGTLRGLGIFINESTYADVTKIDPQMPCFRFGAFGTEGQNTKRVNGLFSFLAPNNRDADAVGLDFLWYVTAHLDVSSFTMFAAQAPSDATALTRFYDRYFQRQGGFPIYGRMLA